jgi:hypothetical protein
LRTREPVGTTARHTVGLMVTAVGAGSLVILSVQPTLEFRISQHMSVFTAYEWLLALTLVGVGLAIALSGPFSEIGAASGAIVAAQLGSAGAGAFKQWYSFFGPRGGDSSRHDDLEVLALVMSALCLLAVAGCLWYLVQRNVFTNDAASTQVRCALVAIAVAIIVGLPIALSIEDNSTNWETLAAFGLLYSLPWGIAVLAAGWLRLPIASGVCAVVAIFALAAAQTSHFIFMSPHSAFAYSSAAALAALAGAIRYGSTRSVRTMSVES